MATIFTVKNDDLARLEIEEAVVFFHDLLCAEGRRTGVPISKIHVSSRINVPDGGVDASVEENSASEQNDLIKAGYTNYQIKTGIDFKPWQKSKIKKELFNEKDPGKDNLGSSVRNCLDKNGTYILVCFKQDPTDEQHRQAVKIIKDYFEQCHYQNPKVEVWGQKKLIGLLKVFPSLALAVNKRENLKFQTHKSWSQDAEMRKKFILGEAQRDFLSNMQNELRKDNEPVHTHVWGAAGIGKTRLALEATREEDLQPLVIYCDSARKFRDSSLMNEILREDNQFHLILILDECDPDSRSYIWNKLKYRSPRIKLISIYNESDDISGNINFVEAPSLEKEQVSKIIQEYTIPKYQADRWSEICDNSPRVAHVIGQNLRENPEDILKSPDTVNVWERYIVGYDDSNNQEAQQRRLVLQYIALFKRFGYAQPVVSESQAIAEKVKQADPQITWSKFQKIIDQLKQRRILQGEYMLYITPQPLHIKLWIDWWNTYGNMFDLEEFSKDLSPKLLEWFYEMFIYAAGSKNASLITKEFLEENGPFQNKNYLKTKLGAKFFLALAEADPEAALNCLKKTVGTWSKEELLQFTTGRREVVWALENIAEWRNLFSDAARLLLALGEAENETWANNASGVFADLFSLGWGTVASTEAPPQERFPVLKEAMESSSKVRRQLALNACDQALEAEYFARGIYRRQGLRKEPQLWMPETRKERFDAHREVWQLIVGKLEFLPEDEQQQGVNILLKRARGLVRIQPLADMVIKTLKELAKKPYVDIKEVLTRVVQILHYEGKDFPQQTRKRLEQLRNDLTGSDFSSLMKRYVGMYLLEDEFDEEGNHVDILQERIQELAKQSTENWELLESELDWLVTTEAKNGYSFGYKLGKTDKDFSLLPKLIKAQRKESEDASVSFLSGYFHALFEKDQKKWEEILDTIAEDKKLNRWVPELTGHSEMSDRAALRILDLAEKGEIDTKHFWPFCFGRSIQNISEDIFKKWIEFLLSSSDTHAISIALDLFHFYYIYKESKCTLPEDLTLKLLIHQSLFQKSQRSERGQLDDHHWVKIGIKFVKIYPKSILELVDIILKHFGEDGTILEGFHTSTQAVINEITRLYPVGIWRQVTKYLGPPIDSRAFHIKNWLKGNELFDSKKEGALPMIPLEEIWEWVDEDMEKRAWYLASFVPKKLFRKEGKTCLAREVLVRYGNRKDVIENFIANFSTESWSGPESLHCKKKKQQLLNFMEGEDNENVKKWIEEYVSLLDRRIERAKIEEERRDF